ncbi:MAG: hypothetical protein ACKVQS_10300 [Fimbriimonadaceae bacterium]
MNRTKLAGSIILVGVSLLTILLLPLVTTESSRVATFEELKEAGYVSEPLGYRVLDVNPFTFPSSSSPMSFRRADIEVRSIVKNSADAELVQSRFKEEVTVARQLALSLPVKVPTESTSLGLRYDNDFRFRLLRSAEVLYLDAICLLVLGDDERAVQTLSDAVKIAAFFEQLGDSLMSATYCRFSEFVITETVGMTRSDLLNPVSFAVLSEFCLQLSLIEFDSTSQVICRAIDAAVVESMSIGMKLQFEWQYKRNQVPVQPYDESLAKKLIYRNGVQLLTIDAQYEDHSAEEVTALLNYLFERRYRLSKTVDRLEAHAILEEMLLPSMGIGGSVEFRAKLEALSQALFSLGSAENLKSGDVIGRSKFAGGVPIVVDKFEDDRVVIRLALQSNHRREPLGFMDQDFVFELGTVTER